MKLKGGSSQFKKERKELYAEVAKIYNMNDRLSMRSMKEEKEIHTNFAVTPQTAKIMATLYKWKRH